MDRKSKILALIPARAGSKGLPNKNIKLLSGKPMIAWTIEAALRSKYIDKVLISTDSPSIKEIAENYGAWAPFLRPFELATDQAEMLDVASHAIQWVTENSAESYEYIILLQPTAPLRDERHIDEAVARYFQKKTEKYQCLVSVYSVSVKYNWLLRENENNFASFSFPMVDAKFSRQKMKPVFLPNGAIYVAPIIGFSGFFSDENILYIMSDSDSIDVDSESDFKIAEMMLASKMPV